MGFTLKILKKKNPHLKIFPTCINQLIATFLDNEDTHLKGTTLINRNYHSSATETD